MACDWNGRTKEQGQSERCPITKIIIARRFCVAVFVVLFGAASALRIALAHGSEEGVANFYSDSYQGTAGWT